VTDLLTGTVTFLFTDVERSTELLGRSPQDYARTLNEHRGILRAEVAERGGREVDSRGEEFFFAFARANDAVAAAVAAQSRLGRLEWPAHEAMAVRMGIHTGEPTVNDAGYLGLDVHRAARICSLAHGGQVLISRTTRDLLVLGGPAGIAVREVGRYRLKGFAEPDEVFQVDAAGLRWEFPAPRNAESAESSSAGRERELAAAALKALRPTRLRPRRVAGGGLADLGWEVRAQLPAAPEPLRSELAELGGKLFAASRSVVAVDRYLAGVDRKSLTRRLAEETELGVLSKRAATEAEATAGRIQLVDALGGARSSAEQRIEAVRSAVRRICIGVQAGAHQEMSELVESARRNLRALVGELDPALEVARAAVQATGRLRRTPRRGIYRRGDRYVVPYIDEVGIEHENQFETMAAARAFRDVRRMDEQGTADVCSRRPGSLLRFRSRQRRGLE
jgi:class 3 adenylate cyclase